MGATPLYDSVYRLARLCDDHRHVIGARR
jgi:hypothetical protein